MKTQLLFKSLTVASALSFILFFENCGNSSNQSDNDVVEEVSTGEALFPDSLIRNKDTFRIQNPSKPSNYELKHTPEIDLGSPDAQGITTIAVKMGSEGIVHPEEENHWIYCIELQIDGKVLEHRLFANNSEAGKTEFKANLKDAKKIAVWASCNKHGIWGNEILLGKN
jgi:superoxide reductase